MVVITNNIFEHMVVDILQTGNMLERLVSQVFKDHGITNVQYNILRILKGATPDLLTVGEVKNRVRFYNSDITRLLDRLVHKDLVTRQVCDENRRQIHVAISEKGLQLIQKLRPEIESVLNNFYQDEFSDEEAMELSRLLSKIRNNISSK